MGLKTCIAAVAVLAAMMQTGRSQDARGTITGLVTDSSGAVIPNAQVKAIQLEMGTNTPTRANASGNFELPFLLPGPYRVEVQAEGFKTYKREPIEVRVGETSTVDVKMELGAVAESVQVMAEASLLDENSATLGQTVDRHQLENLPIAGDDVMYLMQLGAGITTTQTPAHNWLPSAVDIMSKGNAGGTPNGSNEFSLDGIPNMAGNQVSFAPPSDIVQEFRVEVAKYDASLGHGMGAHVNMSIKAGTNGLHGTASWLIAPKTWQANDFFANKQLYDLTTGPVTPEKRAQMAPPRKVNRYTFTASGPLVIPKLYNGRNRTFWTYGFQGFNRRNPTSTYLTVPTADERRGDFSKLLALGSKYQIYDPMTTVPAATAGRYARQPIPGNIISPSRLDPNAQKILTYFPLPNALGTKDFQDNYQVSGNNSNDFLQHMGRVDHIISDRHHVFGRYTQSWLNWYRNQYFPNESRGLDRYRFQHGIALDDVYIVSPSFLVNVKYGFTLFQQTDHPFSTGFDMTKLGMSQAFVSQLDPQAVSFPQVAIELMDKLGEATNTNNTTNYHTWGLNITEMQGKHSLKWGWEYRLLREHAYDFGNGTPLLNFNNNYTRGPQDNSGGAPIGDGLASFVLGIPTGGNVDINASSATQSTFMGLYLQDDWKIARRVTLNLGMRWELETAPTERFDRSVLGFDFQTPNPISSIVLANYAKSPIPQVAVSDFKTLGGLTFTGLNGNPREIFQTSRKNFAPRAGLAWAVARGTVIRAGYGIFYDLLGVDHTSINQNGFSQRTLLVPTQDNGQTYVASIANPFPNVVRPGQVSMLTYLGQTVNFQPAYRPAPYAQNWSFSIQRQFRGRMLLDFSYMGNRLTRMAANREYDAIPAQYLSTKVVRDQAAINFNTAAVTNPFYGVSAFAASNVQGLTVARSQLLKPYPQFTSITAPDPVGFSWYHSLQVRFNKRVSRGASFNVAYTFSKMMEAINFLNDTDPTPEHVISSLDRPHRLVVTAVYELPFGKGWNKWLRAPFAGWQVQSIYQAQSGPALSFANIAYYGDIHDIVLPKDQRTPERWFNTDAPFEKLLGNALGQNIRYFPSRLAGLRGPGINYWDLSAAKNFRIGEHTKLQLRTNWEGAMNHPHFANPNMVPTNVLFGSITAIAGEARRVYAGLKMYF